MYETVEEGYKRYLIECERHRVWLTEQYSTKFKRFMFYLANVGIERNVSWVKQLQSMELALGLFKEEKQKHTL